MESGSPRPRPVSALGAAAAGGLHHRAETVEVGPLQLPGSRDGVKIPAPGRYGTALGMVVTLAAEDRMDDQAESIYWWVETSVDGERWGVVWAVEPEKYQSIGALGGHAMVRLQGPFGDHVRVHLNGQSKQAQFPTGGFRRVTLSVGVLEA